MISALSPVFLWAGVALALVPLALHFVARRPPERRPLPTARFLREDARTRLRVERRPRDLPLLLVRMAFALAAGAIFAGMTWLSDREGSRHVVLLDGGASTAGAWEEAVGAARDALVAGGGPDGEAVEILAYGLDGGARPVDEGALASLRPGDGTATFEDGLRALRRHVVDGTRAASARVTWVTSPRWSAWTEGFGLLRPALWPGRIEVVTVGGASDEGPAEPLPEPPLALIPDTSSAGPLTLALETLGWRVGRETTASGAGAGPAAVFADAPGEAELDGLRDRARAGATVVVWGAAEDPRAVLPWRRARAAPAGEDAGALVLADGVTLEVDARGDGGVPAPGARVVAVFENGAPAAAARPMGQGCLAFVSVPLDSRSLAELPDYPHLVGTLATACAPAPGGDDPLDAGAVAVLEAGAAGSGEGGDAGSGGGADNAGDATGAAVDVASLALPDGLSLTVPFVVLALLLLAADVVMARRRAP